MNEEEIRHLAKLASLKLTDAEVKKYAEDMKGIVEFANEVSKVNTDGVDISATSLDIFNVFRKDEVKESYDREELLQNCKYIQDGMFKIPKVMD